MNRMMECWIKKIIEILGLIWAKLRIEYFRKDDGGEKVVVFMFFWVLDW